MPVSQMSQQAKCNNKTLIIKQAEFIFRMNFVSLCIFGWCIYCVGNNDDVHCTLQYYDNIDFAMQMQTLLDTGKGHYVINLMSH